MINSELFLLTFQIGYFLVLSGCFGYKKRGVRNGSEVRRAEASPRKKRENVRRQFPETIPSWILRYYIGLKSFFR